MAPDELRAIVCEALEQHPEVARVDLDHTAPATLSVTTVDGEEYLLEVEWSGGLHPGRFLGSDSVSRDTFVAEMEARQRS